MTYFPGKWDIQQENNAGLALFYHGWGCEKWGIEKQRLKKNS